MSGKYTIDSKSLITAIERCTAVIALGEKADNNVIMMSFHKKGLRIGAQNTVATYAEDVVIKIEEATKQRISIIPTLLLSYAKSYKELTLQPQQDHMVVTSRGFEAKMFYIGEAQDITIDKPEEAMDISNITKAAQDAIARVSSMRNRTDSNPLGVVLAWGKGNLEVTVGDTHHAIIVDSKVKQKESNSITTVLPNLQKIMDVGKHFALKNDVFYAWSDSEYLAISNKVENMFLADIARKTITEPKKSTRAVVATDKFRSMIDTLTNAVDETDVVRMVIREDKILANIKTAAGTAKSAVKIDSFKGKAADIKISVHHLRDCLSPIKEKKMAIFVSGENLIGFEAKTKTTVIISAASIVGGGT